MQQQEPHTMLSWEWPPFSHPHSHTLSETVIGLHSKTLEPSKASDHTCAHLKCTTYFSREEIGICCGIVHLRNLKRDLIRYNLSNCTSEIWYRDITASLSEIHLYWKLKSACATQFSFHETHISNTHELKQLLALNKGHLWTVPALITTHQALNSYCTVTMTMTKCN